MDKQTYSSAPDLDLGETTEEERAFISGGEDLKTNAEPINLADEDPFQIKKVLPKLDEDKRLALVKKLKDDLKVLIDDDLAHVTQEDLTSSSLSPIEARKLMKHWEKNMISDNKADVMNSVSELDLPGGVKINFGKKFKGFPMMRGGDVVMGNKTTTSHVTYIDGDNHGDIHMGGTSQRFVTNTLENCTVQDSSFNFNDGDVTDVRVAK